MTRLDRGGFKYISPRSRLPRSLSDQGEPFNFSQELKDKVTGYVNRAKEASAKEEKPSSLKEEVHQSTAVTAVSACTACIETEAKTRASNDTPKEKGVIYLGNMKIKLTEQ